MPRRAYKQSTFAGGEISPELYGRTDIERYAQSVRSMLNWVVTPSGAAKNRPGMRYIATAKDASNKPRLLPFVFSDDQAYMLEFSDYNVRVYFEGAAVLAQDFAAGQHTGGTSATTLTDANAAWTDDQWIGATIYNLTDGSSGIVNDSTATTIVVPSLTGGVDNQWEVNDSYRVVAADATEFVDVETIFPASVLPDIRISQRNDVVIITHKDYRPQQLRRIAHDSWDIGPYTVIREARPPTNVALDWTTSTSPNGWASATQTHEAKRWEWVVTTVTTSGEESLPSSPLVETAAVYYSDKYTPRLTWNEPSEGPTPREYNVYQGRDGVYGYIGTTEATTFELEHISPDYTDTPPEETDPLEATIEPQDTIQTYHVVFQTSGPTAGTAIKFAEREAFDDCYTFVYSVTVPALRNNAKVEIKYRTPSGSGPYNTVETVNFPFRFVAATYEMETCVVKDGWGADVQFDIVPTQCSVVEDEVVYDTKELIEQTIATYPAVSLFYEQRLVFLGFSHDTQVIRGSKTGDYFNFDTHKPLRDDDPFDFTLDSKVLNEIRDAVALQTLFVLTAGDEWVLQGSEGGPLTPLSFDAKPRSSYGIGRVPALTVGESVLFLGQESKQVFAMMFDRLSQVSQTQSLSTLADHLLLSESVADWDYARQPFSVVWAARTDGAMLGLTYVPRQNVWAWHRHETGPRVNGVLRDEVESVCVVPERSFGESRVYLAVKRTINGSTVRYIESFVSRVQTEVEDYVFLDSALSFDGRNTTSDSLRLTGYRGAHDGGAGATLEDSSETWVPGQWVGKTVKNITAATEGEVTANTVDTLTADGVTWTLGDAYEIVSGYQAGDEVDIIFVGTGTPFLSSDVGIEYRITNASGVSCRVRVTEFVSSGQVRGFLVSPAPSDLQDATSTDWGRAFNTFSGLGHLEGETVGALVDGGDHQDMVVSSGAVTLGEGRYGERVHIGLRYNSDVQSLPPAMAPGDTISNKQVVEVGVEVDRATGLQLGVSFDDLEEAQEHLVSDGWGYTDPRNELALVRPGSGFQRLPTVAVRQSRPLPVTLLSLLAIMEIGGSG